MSTLNRYVLSHAYPEGSMIEAYTIEEAINYYTKYIRDGRAIGLHREESTHRCTIRNGARSSSQHP
jgi:hypothetical protein